MAELLFGTAGIPHSASTRTTLDGIRRVADLGLGCMEVEFVQGVKMGEAGARLVAEIAAAEGIALSAHAPYYVNFNAHEPEKIRASQERLLHTVRIGSLCGVRSIVLHTAFYLGDPPEQVYDAVKKYLGEVIDRIRKDNYRLLIRPEVMGKPSQFGTIDEILRLCTELERLAPCVDFAHWHARTGVNNSYREFSAVLSQINDSLGREALDDMHIHFSGIQYGAKGERKHLNLKESDLNYIELLRALKDHEVGGLVICESPNLEGDALMLQETYQGLWESA
ncbi:MAG: TIM barrel protein [Dehalococcoidales bacterium]|jgi:deoxyribonuclease-4|nr:TIM barrel protein [Dehalococcoidales bacterium]